MNGKLAIPRIAVVLHRAIVPVLLAITFSALAAPGRADAEVLHRERSLYQTILVTREPGRLCLQFSRRKDQRNQSCMNPRHPKRMVFTYTRMMMAALLLNPQPANVLMVGLGGGTLPTALGELLPETTVDVVEIDPAVLSVAENFFAFAANDRLRVHLSDARVFVKRRLRGDLRYDLIMLDAYAGDYIPEHLMTVEFLEETRALLTPGGVVAATRSPHRAFTITNPRPTAKYSVCFSTSRRPPATIASCWRPTAPCRPKPCCATMLRAGDGRCGHTKCR